MDSNRIRDDDIGVREEEEVGIKVFVIGNESGWSQMSSYMMRKKLQRKKLSKRTVGKVSV